MHTTTILVHWLSIFLGPVSERKDCVRTTISRHNSGRPLSDVKLLGASLFSEVRYAAAARYFDSMKHDR